MDNELLIVFQSVIDSLVKLESLLHLQQSDSIHTAEEVASHLLRTPVEVKSALDALAEAGLVERYAFGTGKHVMYGTSQDPHVKRIMNILHEMYHSDPQSRAELIKQAVGSAEESSVEVKSKN